MKASAPGGEPGQSRRPRVRAADQDDGSAWRLWRREYALTLDDFRHSIALMEAVSRVENDLAETLRSMAGQDGDEAAARRLKLAEDAARGAQAAARISARLHEQARRWAERAEAATVGQALEHTARVLADLDGAESDLAAAFTDLARHGPPDVAVRRRLLAAEAAAGAQHARDRARALRQLAQTEAAGAQPDGTPAAGPEQGPAPGEPSRDQRLADIDHRLTELRRARPEPPDGDPAQAVDEAQQRAQAAKWHQQQSATRSARARQLAGQGLERAAAAHDRAAQAEDRSAGAGIGDVAGHTRRAAFHRAAAQADRQRAQDIQRQTADPRAAGPDNRPRWYPDRSR